VLEKSNYGAGEVKNLKQSQRD